MDVNLMAKKSVIDYLMNRIERLIIEGYKKFYIYPFGNIGMIVKDILEKRYGILDCVGIDNSLCMFNKKILSCKELEGKVWNDTETLILASNNSLIYRSIRTEIKKYVPLNCIKDMFPVPPLINHSDHRIASLAAAGREIYRRNVMGSVAEAGVYQGEFAKFINIIFPDRKLYLFDSFEGFEAKSVREDYDNKVQVKEWINTLKDTSIEIVMKKMNFPENIIIKKGFIPDTTKDVIDKFCFVNLDMDLYLPTYEGLKFFWENLSNGGYIFVHDFYIWDGVEAAVRKFCEEMHIGYGCLTDACSIVLSKPF